MTPAMPNQARSLESSRGGPLPRREFLRVGLLGMAGLSLSELLRLEAKATAQAFSTSRQKSVIILWMRGGPSHLDMWDPKPDAPLEYRGEFKAVPTKVPGIQLTELLPRCGRIMDKWSIIRSLHHDIPDHFKGDQVCLTGYPPGPNPEENVMPSCGSIVAKQLQHKNRRVPAYVVVRKMAAGMGSAYLGKSCDPFQTIADPNKDGPFRIPNFELPEGISLDRLGNRRSLLEGMDRLRREMDQSGQMEAMDEFQQRAWDIVTSKAAREAFDLDAESQAMRERYGLLPAFKPAGPDRFGVPGNWGQRVLLARRLVEGGVRLVTVDMGNWDAHKEIFDELRSGFLPRWDLAYSALIEDLDQRGLLDSTMVIAWGEFGRTPRISSANAGRDHWSNVFSAAVAGGGIQGGRVVGSSDEKGESPDSNPKTPQDLLATLYRHLGVDTTVQYADHTGRPHPVLPSGTPIDELF